MRLLVVEDSPAPHHHLDSDLLLGPSLELWVSLEKQQAASRLTWRCSEAKPKDMSCHHDSLYTAW